MSEKRVSSGKNTEMQDWERFEYIVAYVEQVINPGAIVEHDVWLFERRAKRMVQCDVVIRYGKSPRDTLTIVEVQKRKKKVDRHMFNAWCVKRDNVGAQQLICVSRRGFDETVIESAKEEGKSAKLVTVLDAQNGSLPFTFTNRQLNLLIPKAKILGYSVETNEEIPTEIKVSSATFLRKGQPVSIDKLVKHAISPTKSGKSYEADHRVDFNSDDEVVMIVKERSVRLKSVTVNLLVETEKVVLDMSALDYTQLDYDGVLAWCFEGVGVFRDEKASLVLIFSENENGAYDGAILFGDGLADVGASLARFTIEYSV